MFAVLDKTEIIIYESNIFSGSSENFKKFFRKFSGKYFSGKIISLICGQDFYFETLC